MVVCAQLCVKFWKKSQLLKKKQTNKHRVAKQRTSEVMKKIAPALDEDSRSKKSNIVKELVFKLKKREKKWWSYWYANITSDDTTRLSSDARNYISSLLDKKRRPCCNQCQLLPSTRQSISKVFSFSTPRICCTPHFPHSPFSTLCIFHAPRSTLHAPRSTFHNPDIPPNQEIREDWPSNILLRKYCLAKGAATRLMLLGFEIFTE